MNSPDEDWWIEQSGEYVLGTLSHAEWITFRKAAEHDIDAQRLIVDWEHTFQPLADSLEPLDPPSYIWKAIEARLSIGVSSQDENSVVSLEKFKKKTKFLQASVDRWRNFAGLATAASILIASVAWINHLGVRDQVAVEPIASVAQYDSISIIRNEQSLPLWVVDTALGEGLVRVTAIAPPEIGEASSYQLWIVKPDDAGVQSVGLIPQNTDQSIVLNIQAETDKPVAYAVSLEASGGSTQDVPTGPVLYQGLVQELRL